MRAAVYGKHPGYGDFLSGGLSAAAVRLLEGWCEGWMTDLRPALGADWPVFWAGAPVVRLWLGEAVAGEVLCGLLQLSQDRVGRRYPLFILVTGEDPAALPDPPVLQPEDDLYTRLASVELPAKGGVTALLAALDPADLLAGVPPGAGLAGPQAFWAERAFEPGPAGAAGLRLLADVALADHRRAAAGRCYLWRGAVPGRPARFHAGEGLPAPQVLHWLLESGAPAQDAVQDTVQDVAPGAAEAGGGA